MFYDFINSCIIAFIIKNFIAIIKNLSFVSDYILIMNISEIFFMFNNKVIIYFNFFFLDKIFFVE